jgi:hypothetical protein
MPTDTGDLMEKVYDLFSGIYAAKAGDGAFLAFEKLGVPITAGMFKLQSTDTQFSPALAVERLSEIGNAVLQVDGDSVRRSNRTVPAMTELMLTQSMPISPDANAMASLGRARTPAAQAFDVTLGSMDGMFRFHPVYASPTDWYDPGANDNWTGHTIGKQEGLPPPAPPAPPAQPAQPTPPGPPSPKFQHQQLTWRIAPKNIQPDLSEPVSRTNRLYSTLATSPQVAPIQNSPTDRAQFAARRQMFAKPGPGPSSAPRGGFLSSGFLQRMANAASTIASSGQPTTAASIMKTAGPLIMAQATGQLQANTTAQPVSTNSIDMSFEHCVVTLNRPWWPEVFLMLKQWFVPGYACAEFSDGTGGEDAGLLPILASGFVAIRNLKISTKWSNDDIAAMQGAASFGPFSLVGRTYDAGTGTLTCPGIQIIGWFCEALPILPPNSDPAIDPPPATPSTPAQDGSTSPPSGTTSSPPSDASSSPPSGTTSSPPGDTSSSPPSDTTSSPPADAPSDESSSPSADTGTTPDKPQT